MNELNDNYNLISQNMLYNFPNINNNPITNNKIKSFNDEENYLNIKSNCMVVSYKRGFIGK